MDSTQQTFHIGIETGGTSCKVGIFKSLTALPNDAKHLELIHSHQVPTRSPQETVKDLTDFLDSFSEYEYTSIGIAAFGPICLDEKSEQYGYVTTTPKEGWKNTPILSMILESIQRKKSQGFKVVFDTDVNMVAAFEHKFGGHKDVKQNLVYITVGTGIGLGVVVNGQTVRGLVHPEGGHIMVPILESDKDFAGVCPFHGKCLEGLCTNVAIQKRLGLASVEDNINISNDNDVWERIGYYLGVCCANLILTISVEKIIIGGGVMNREILYDIIRKHCFNTLNGYIQHEKLSSIDKMKNMIVQSNFAGDHLGILAAAMMGAIQK